MADFCKVVGGVIPAGIIITSSYSYCEYIDDFYVGENV